MFGENPVSKPTWDSDVFPVREMFETIQGEGPFTGTPATFIRFGGCNLQCAFCDTDFDEEESDQVDLPALVQAARDARPKLVVLTGGEPFLRPLGKLVPELLGEGLIVQVETAGTVAQPSDFNPFFQYSNAHVVISPKTPRLGGLWDNLPGPVDFKYVVNTEMSFRDSDGLPAHLAPPQVGSTVWLQPMDEQNEGKNKLNTALAVRLAREFGHRVSLQTHKILGLP